MLTKIRVEGESRDLEELRKELRKVYAVVVGSTRGRGGYPAQPSEVVDEHYELLDEAARHTDEDWYRGRVVAVFGQSAELFDACGYTVGADTETPGPCLRRAGHDGPHATVEITEPAGVSGEVVVAEPLPPTAA